MDTFGWRTAFAILVGRGLPYALQNYLHVPLEEPERIFIAAALFGGGLNVAKRTVDWLNKPKTPRNQPEQVEETKEQLATMIDFWAAYGALFIYYYYRQ